LAANRAIVVLGMHRSGTSCLTGMLEEAGVFLGGVSRQNPHNLKGNHENPQIMELHEDLLRANGGSWDNPPLRVSWSARHEAARDEIIRGYARSEVWGFKDPRTLLTLEGWAKVLPNLARVGIFRHPRLAAQSLQARNGMPIEQGIELWCFYNERLLHYWDQHRFPLISFDGEEHSFRAAASRLLDSLGLALPSGGLTFFEPGLRTIDVRNLDHEIPERARRLHQRLIEIAS
jgi:hypothetical protein